MSTIPRHPTSLQSAGALMRRPLAAWAPGQIVSPAAMVKPIRCNQVPGIGRSCLPIVFIEPEAVGLSRNHHVYGMGKLAGVARSCLDGSFWDISRVTPSPMRERK
ncbi:MAG TPA: hypothetical protein VMI06_00135 [Terriglobia bacterium]|nr:hypothetical protein [Terriglobia bacterium]